MGYVGLMEKFGSDEIFATLYLPVTIANILQQFNNSYEQLGNTGETVWQDPLKSGWKKPGFGAWIQDAHPNLTNYTMNFTSVQMKGLYGVLGNTSLLFGETANKTVKEECEWDPAQKKCGFLLQAQAAAVLQQFNQSTTNTSLFWLMGAALCPNNTYQCFDKLDLLEAIFSYIGHVNKYTMWVILGEQFDIVTTMPQKSLSLGYTIKNVIDPKTRAPVFIPGVVRVHSTKTDASNADKESTFYTCEAGDSKKFQWAGK
jgi:hypothetical protein